MDSSSHQSEPTLRDVYYKLGQVYGELKGVHATLEKQAQDSSRVEARIRVVEKKQSRILGYIAGGSGVGAGLASAVSYLLKLGG